MASYTRFVLSQIHPKYKAELESLRKLGLESDNEFASRLARAEIRGYLTALNGAGIISDSQFRVLYTYYTLNLD